MSVPKEFRDFALRGNVLGLAIGKIVGAVLEAIVSSLKGDVFVPVVALVGGQVDLSNAFLVLDNPNSVALISRRPPAAMARAA